MMEPTDGQARGERDPGLEVEDGRAEASERRGKDEAETEWTVMKAWI